MSHHKSVPRLEGAPSRHQYGERASCPGPLDEELRRCIYRRPLYIFNAKERGWRLRRLYFWGVSTENSVWGSAAVSELLQWIKSQCITRVCVCVCVSPTGNKECDPYRFQFVVTMLELHPHYPLGRSFVIVLWTVQGPSRQNEVRNRRLVLLKTCFAYLPSIFLFFLFRTVVIFCQ